MKYIVYCRKSSESEERQALSIVAQIDEANRLAERENLEIIKTYTESQSAKQKGRPVFCELLEQIEKSQGVGLIVWKLDRLARNAFDGGQIIDLMDRGLIKEIRTPGRLFLNTSEDKFMMALDFGISKKYVDDLSLNVKRGNRAKLERGGWPSKAPIGYLHDRLEKTIVLDVDRAPFIEKAFKLYASKAYSLKDVTNILAKAGFRSKSGRLIYKSKIYHILTNPFYCGVMKQQGKSYVGNHQPIISKELFEQVDQIINRRSNGRRKTREFTYRSFLTCEVCGCAITATQKKGHDYYYCTNGKNQCEEHKKYLRSEKVDEKFAGLLEKLNFDEELVELAYRATLEKKRINRDYVEKAKFNLVNQRQTASRKKEKLLDSYLSEMIDKETYEAKMTELNAEQIGTDTELKRLENQIDNGKSTLELTKNIILNANLAKKEYLEANENAKRKFLEKTLWNLTFKQGEISSFKLKKPYQMMIEAPLVMTFETMCAHKDSNLGPCP